MVTVDKIRRDLRDLRRISHSIKAALTVKENHRKRIEYLEELGTPEARREAEKIKRLVSSLKLEESIARASELESRYMTAIGGLERLDRTILLEGYINGKPYWKIGKEIGYSERSVQARMNSALEKLSRVL